MRCNKCNKETDVFVYSRTLDMVVCKQCKADTGELVKGHRGIYDATGAPRDRDWLRDKLAMTRTEKKWHQDIRSRKLMPDGTVRRIKR